MGEKLFSGLNVTRQNNGPNFAESRMMDHAEPAVRARPVVDKVAQRSAVSIQSSGNNVSNWVTTYKAKRYLE